jgi:ribA/ribD-fused uncharacterized protein
MEFTFFWRPWKEGNGFLGNWYTSPFVVDDIKYNCVEQYIMRGKALLFGDEEVEKEIMSTNNPRKHKSLGRMVEGFDNDIWDEHKEDVLYEAVYAKFSQNDDLKQQLLDTGDTIIAEASPYDKIYGIGVSGTSSLARDPKKWKGENLLGKTLMRVRKELS